jgi:electron transport complex protein RnfD
MEFVKQTSPYIRKENSSTTRMMIDVLIALLPVVIFAIYRFGMDAVVRILVSLVIMIGLEAVAFAMMHKAKGETRKEKLKSRFQTYTINNVTTPAISAIIYTMIVPSALPIYAVAVGAIFAIVVVKMLFGGLGSNIFNVAAAGRLFVSIALAGMFASAHVGIDLVAGATPLSALKSGMGFPDVLNSYSISDLFFGFIPGTMGEISAIPILIGLAYLLIRKAADYRIVLSTTLTFLVLISLVGIFKYNDNWFEFVLFNLFSGGLLFGVAFMATDPVTAPVTRPGRLIYGLLIGTLVVLIRTWGSYAEGVAFALLFANVFVPLIDYPSWATNKYSWKFVGIFAGVFVVIAVVVSLAAGGAFL